MSRFERMPHELIKGKCARHQHDEAETAGEAEIFQKLPEVLQPLPFLESPESGKAPKLMEQHRREHAKSAEDESRQSIVPPGHDAQRHDNFDADGNHEEQSWTRHAACLLPGRFPVQNLVQGTEGKQHHQTRAQNPGCAVVDETHDREINGGRG